MDGVLRDLVEAHGGVVATALARQVVPEWTLRRACRSGYLVRALPAVYVAGDLVLGEQDAYRAIGRVAPIVGRRVALAWAGGR
ncbi:hypothetical protein ACTMS0_14480 [Micromonospora sp. H33]|uniref:hypothetical protein n=1 Tax=Micromonospora sp. H33 TaxID=3452215 RepID=UPI003F8A4FF9